MASPQEFSLQLESRNGVSRIALHGEIDMLTAPALDEALVNAEQDGIRAIMVDLRNVTFIDVMGVHALVRARAHADINQHRLVIVGASPSAHRLFDVTGTEWLVADQEYVSVLDEFMGSRDALDSEAAGDRHVDA